MCVCVCVCVVCVCVCCVVCVCACVVETNRETRRQTERQSERGTEGEGVCLFVSMFCLFVRCENIAVHADFGNREKSNTVIIFRQNA